MLPVEYDMNQDNPIVTKEQQLDMINHELYNNKINRH